MFHKLLCFSALSALAFPLGSIGHGDTFGTDPNTTFEIEFVTVGNPGNAADTTGDPNSAGSVPYEYRIGKFEISEDMIDKANADGGLGITQDTRGPNQPATSVSWFEAARFVNWLNTSTDNSPAYNFDPNGSFQLWNQQDEGYDPNNLYRNSLAKYVLPTVHEWYKAAYYDPNSNVYYDYPTGSDIVPDGIDFVGDTTFDAVFSDGGANLQPNDITDVGVLSSYGTAGQGGNVWEWEETAFDLENDTTGENHAHRGGAWNDNSNSLRSIRRDGNVSTENPTVGFRVASVPELSADFDGNGVVDGNDFLLWQRGGSPGGGTQAELALWEADYGTLVTLSATSTTVPEPTTCTLALAALCLAMSRRR